MKTIARLLVLSVLTLAAEAGAQVVTYCCDETAEAAYLAAIAGLGVTVNESFEAAPFDQVRPPFSLPSITNQGITWSQPTGGITTNNFNSWDGAYQMYAVGPDLVTHPIPDGFTVSGDGITFRAMAGWFTGQNTKMAFTVDGDPARVDFTGEELTVLDWKFLGFVDTTPFSSVVVSTADEVGNETKLFWTDYFTFSASGAPPSPGSLQFGSASATVAENGGSILVTVTRSGGSDGAVSIGYATVDGNATAGSDYTATSGTLNFADGVTSQSFSVPILDDSSYEGNEAFTIQLSGPTGGATVGTVSTTTITISENDAAPPAGSLQLGAASYLIAEDGVALQVTVTRTGGSFGAVSVNYTTTDGSATAGSDYQATSGTLALGDGVMSAGFNVPIIDDANYEGSESFSIILSAPGGGASLGTPASATVTISDNDPTPPAGSLQFSATSYTVAENAASVLVTVTRSGGSFGAVAVDYSTADGSATAGGDYTAASGTLNFADGVASQSFSVGMLDDTAWEGNEQFTVTLSNAVGGASLGTPAAASVTITENDPVPPAGSLQYSGASYGVAEDGGSVLLTVTRTGGSFGEVSVDYSTLDGTATAGSDYTSTSGTLTFADGVTSQAFSVPVLDDTDYEGNESFTVQLSNATGGATPGSPSLATVTIQENDPTPPAGSLQLSGATYSVAENGGSVLLTVTRSGGSFGTVTVDYATVDGSAAAGSDYSATSGTLSLAGGVTSASFPVAVLDDAVYEGNESFAVVLSNPTGSASLGSPWSAAVVINENDAVPPAGSLHFSGASYTIAENGGSVLLTVTRSGGSFGAVSVSYSTSDLSATAGLDYSAASGTLNFANGEISRSFNVGIIDDLVYEGDETFAVTLANPTGSATLGAPSLATVTITENEATPPAGSLRFSGATYTVGEGGASVLLTVARINGSFGAVSVDYASADGTATTGSDYSAATGTLNFGNGVTSRTISVPILEDALFEGAENFTVSLANPLGGATLVAPSIATVTITDNDAAPPAGSLQFSAVSYSVGENGISAMLTVTRSGGSFGAVSVDYSTSNGTASAGSDYQFASGTLDFAEGELIRTFNIVIHDDGSYEGDETFSVALSNPAGGASLGTPSTASVTIVDNDAAPPSGTLAFEFSNYEITESGVSITLNVLRSGGSFGPVTVDYATTDGSAIATSDYTSTSGTLSFPNGVASQSLTVSILDDLDYEGDEQFTVALSNVTGGASLGTPAVAAVTIREDEAPPSAGHLQFGSATYSVDEAGPSIQLAVTRVGGSAGIVSVDYSTTDLSAAAGSDYQVASGTLVFDDGVLSQTLDVSIVDDADYEGDEVFRVALATPTGGATIGAPATADVTILENDPTPPAGVLQWSGPTYSVAEDGGSLALTVQRVGGSFGDVSVVWLTADGSAAGGVDYTASGDILSFADGVISQTVNVPILDDAAYEGSENFTVELRNPSGGASLGAPATAVVTIADNDPTPPAGSLALSGASYTIAENGAQLLVTVARSGGSFGPVSVDYATADQTASAGADYTAVAGTLSLGSGVLSASFSIPVLDDALYEGDETLGVALSNAVGATLASPTAATVTIVDNDLPPAAGSLQFSSANYSVAEAAASIMLTVSRSGGSFGAVSVGYETRSGSATAGADFTGATGTLNFADGELSQRITISMIDDTAVEGDENFTVALTSASGGASLGTPAAATVTIRENDVNRPSGGGGGGGGAFGLAGAAWLLAVLLLRNAASAGSILRRAVLATTLWVCLFTAPAAMADEHAGHSPQQQAADPHAAHRATAANSLQRSVSAYQLAGLSVTEFSGKVAMLDTLVDTDRTVIVNFIFTTCTTICPVQTATLAQVQRRLGPEAEDVLMLSVSIDPEHDTPERLREYATQFGAGEGWSFLTGTSDEMIAVQVAFDAYMGSKMSHRPLTFLRAPGSPDWVRLEGMASAADIVEEYQRLKSTT